MVCPITVGLNEDAPALVDLVGLCVVGVFVGALVVNVVGALVGLLITIGFVYTQLLEDACSDCELHS